MTSDAPGSKRQGPERTLAAPTVARTVHELRLAVIHGPDSGKAAEIAREKGATVGVLPENDLVLTDPLVSRYHLELVPCNEGILLRDLGSLNGTFLGPVRVRDATIPPGSRVRLGGSILLVESAKAEDATPAADAELPLPGIVFASEAMRHVARAIAKLGPFTGPVLVEGETGTGKEVVANALHQLGPRRSAPFVVVDCGSLPPTLLESHLFGHERGAFSGADRRHVGAFEQAHKGTLFLDEIGELPLSAQPALLGVLARQRFQRLGGDRTLEADVRIVAATNRDLRAAVNRGSFRPDLYYRLAGARIVLPPLRERPEDIPALVAHFVEETTGDASLSPFDDAAMQELCAHHWSGNVRELRSVVERALTLGHLSLEPLAGADGPIGDRSGAPVQTYRDARATALGQFENDYLARLMAHVKGNASEAARLARMDRPYLLSLLRKRGLR
jgi:DNA-binding NtrC family response regulator